MSLLSLMAASSCASLSKHLTDNSAKHSDALKILEEKNTTVLIRHGQLSTSTTVIVSCEPHSVALYVMQCRHISAYGLQKSNICQIRDSKYHTHDWKNLSAPD